MKNKEKNVSVVLRMKDEASESGDGTATNQARPPRKHQDWSAQVDSEQQEAEEAAQTAATDSSGTQFRSTAGERGTRRPFSGRRPSRGPFSRDGNSKENKIEFFSSFRSFSV